MFDEELPKKPAAFTPLVLDRISIEELQDYIGLLKEEIARVEADIKKKQGAKSAADAFFKP